MEMENVRNRGITLLYTRSFKGALTEFLLAYLPINAVVLSDQLSLVIGLEPINTGATRCFSNLSYTRMGAGTRFELATFRI